MPSEVSGWELVRMGEIAAPEKYSCVGGPFGSDLTSKDYTPDGVPVIRGSNLGSGVRQFVDDEFVFVSEEKADSLGRNLAFPGDLVFTQRGTLGQVGLIPDDFKYDRLVVSQSQMKITLDMTKVDRTFVYQYMISQQALREIENRTIATGVPHINLDILRQFPIPLPPLPEQKKIAAILSSVDEAIEATRAVIEQTRRVKEGLLQELLTHHSQTLNDEGMSCSRSFPAGTILITIAANIGDVALTTYPVACPDSLVGIVPMGVDPVWLLYLLATRKSRLERDAPESAQKNINLETLRPLRIAVPSLREQRAIRERIVAVAEAARAETKKLKLVKRLKSGLLQDLLTGKKRVTV